MRARYFMLVLKAAAEPDLVRLKIALVHYTYLPVVGGVETIVAEHARLFASRGHEVRVICQRGASDDPRIEVRNIGAAAGLDAALSDRDIVFVHNLFTMPFAPEWTEELRRLADALPQTRFISWIHDLAACNPDYDLPLGSIFAQPHPRVENVAISEHRREQFERLTGASCSVIPNGTAPGRLLGLTSRVANFAAKERLLTRDLVLFHPTRLLRRKNAELSLRVTAAIRKMGRDCALLVTAPADPHNPASAEYAAMLRDLRRELSLEHDAHFLHERWAVEDADLHSLYTLADALFFPSRQEGFGLPVLEAALHRLPIFCADIQPLNQLLDRALHTFAPDAAPEEIAEQILQTIDRSREIAARKAVARDYSWEAIFEKYLAPLLAPNASSKPT